MFKITLRSSIITPILQMGNLREAEKTGNFPKALQPKEQQNLGSQVPRLLFPHSTLLGETRRQQRQLARLRTWIEILAWKLGDTRTKCHRQCRAPVTRTDPKPHTPKQRDLRQKPLPAQDGVGCRKGRRLGERGGQRIALSLFVSSACLSAGTVKILSRWKLKECRSK